MAESYQILYRGGTAEIVEKKSRFIADTAPVDDEAEAAAFLESIRKKYWDCKHHCSAYVIGAKAELTRCSDDGEPAGTAGRPILDMILNTGIRNVCVVVSRYFGGTLLGTGGLVRAYGQAARAGLDASVAVEKIPGCRLEVTCPYDLVGKLQYLAAGMELKEIESQYSEVVQLSYMVPSADLDRVRNQITEATSARAAVTAGQEIWYALADGQVLLF